MTRIVPLLLILTVLVGPTAEASFLGMCRLAVTNPLEVYRRVLNYSENSKRRSATEELQVAIDSGTFDTSTREVIDTSASRVRSDFEIKVKLPNIESWLHKIGFYSSASGRGHKDTRHILFVPFGKKRIALGVNVTYSSRTSQGEPIREQDDRDGGVFVNAQGRFEERGSFTYGWSGGGTTYTPEGIEVRFMTDGKWSIAGDTLNYHAHPPLVDQNHSFPELTKRKNLALDLTRHVVRTYHGKNGFDRFWEPTNDHVPDVDQNIVRGNGPTNTDPIHLSLDSRGHFMLFVYNLVTVMNLTEGQFVEMRAQVPHYKPLDFLEGSDSYNAINPGQPYVVEQPR